MSSSGYVCVSCGGSRIRKKGTTVFDVGGGNQNATARGTSVALRLLGISSIAIGILGAAALVTSGVGVLAAAMTVGGLGLGAIALRAGARAGAKAERNETVSIESKVLKLAQERGGTISATEVAECLGLSTKEADELLTSMVDGSRVDLEVTPDGLLKYEFHELQAIKRAESSTQLKARVEVKDDIETDAGDASFEEAMNEVEDLLSTEPSK